MADEEDSKSFVGNNVGVQVPSPAPVVVANCAQFATTFPFKSKRHLSQRFVGTSSRFKAGLEAFLRS
jgi:hypothetical protein